MSTGVSYKSSAFHSKVNTSMDCATRDWSNQCDQLRKELARKEHRNEQMTKEMQQTRSSHADLQREMRLTVSTIDKIKSERKHFEDLANDLKNKNQVLTRKLQTANDPTALIDQISKEKKDQLFLNENIVNLRGELSLREAKIISLQKELVIAHRAIDAQSKYEHMMQPNVSNNREIMRTLYFDMGKKQADLHSVTLGLADVTQKLERTESQLKETIEIKEAIYEENEKLKGNLEYLNKQSIEYNDEIAHLRSEIDRGDRLSEHLQNRIEDLSAELSACQEQRNEESSSKQLDIESLSSEVAVLKQERASLRNSLDLQLAAARTSGEVAIARESQLQDEIYQLQASLSAMQQRTELCETLQATCDNQRSKLESAENAKEIQEKRISELLRQLSNKEQESSSAHTTVHALDAHLSSLHVELSKSRDDCAQVISERDEALEALRQTMRATRDLSQKYHQERAHREEVERTNEQLLQAKANLSTATLDALYQERRKSAALEKSLALVPLVLKWRSACIPASSSSEGVKQAAAAYAHAFSSSSSGEGSVEEGSVSNRFNADLDALTQQGSIDVNFLANNISNISKQLDTSQGLHHGVNATFDWLLNEGTVPLRSLSSTDSNRAGPGTSSSSASGAGEEKEEEKATIQETVADIPNTVEEERTPIKAALAGLQFSSLPPAPPLSFPVHAPGQQQEEEKSCSPTKSPGIAAAMAEAYKHTESPYEQRRFSTVVTDSPNSMIGELQRLREELKRIEETAPANTSMNTSAATARPLTSSAGSGLGSGGGVGCAATGSAAVHASTVTTLRRSLADTTTLSNLSVTTNTSITSTK